MEQANQSSVYGRYPSRADLDHSTERLPRLRRLQKRAALAVSMRYTDTAYERVWKLAGAIEQEQSLCASLLADRERWIRQNYPALQEAGA